MKTVENNFWKNKNVLVTGHSGFMGSWLSETLLFLGANVTGISLEDNPDLSSDIRQVTLDIRNEIQVCAFIKELKPEVVFHLAGISNIPYALKDPVGAFTINVGGTVRLLHAITNINSVRAVVIVTSDKCYKNTGDTNWKRETDELGGLDPYSASKAACEIAVQSFFESFLRNKECAEGSTSVASVRVCNLIGGGDMTPGRLLPTLALYADRNMPVELRNPQAIRPWLHVLDALDGYLSLARAMYLKGNQFSGAWNFGPGKADIKTVEEMARNFISLWGGDYRTIESKIKTNEDKILMLNTDKARDILRWSPKLSFEDMMSRTVDFYKRQLSGEPINKVYTEHIGNYFEGN